jgi:hypothetical protein
MKEEEQEEQVEVFETLRDAQNTYLDHLYHHEGICDFNKYHQCKKGYRYFCWSCKKGMRGMMSECHDCVKNK